MSYSQKLYNKVREYLHTSTDNRLHGDNAAIGAVATHWRFTISQAPENHYDEVYPGVYMGDNTVVKNKEQLRNLGITHMLNCSQGNGSRETDTDARFYRDAGIKFLGIKAVDQPTYNMMSHFKTTTEFIDKALKTGGKVFVHCFKGVSRSATIVLAFLMLYRETTLWEAVKQVRAHRKIHPNDGFIRQLCILQNDLDDPD